MVVVITKKVANEYDDNNKKPDAVWVSKKVEVGFDNECDVKEIGTRYCSKQAMECPFNS